MPCEHYKDALMEVAASGAAPSGELRAHLNWCASCRTAFDEEQSLFTAIDTGLHAVTNSEVPPSLIPLVRTRLDEAVTTQRRWIQPFVFASAGVALAFLLLLAVRSHGPAPDNVAEETPAVPSPMAPTGTHKDISPSSVQVASATPNHLHAPRTSTVKHSAASSNPEVLVPPDEREGLAQLVATLNEHGDVTAAFLAHRPEKKDTLVNVDPLEISDIEIKPLEGTETEASDGAGEKH
jgi:hypothetical protein